MAFLRVFLVVVITSCALAQINTPPASQPMTSPPPQATQPAAQSQGAPQSSQSSAGQPSSAQGETTPAAPRPAPAPRASAGTVPNAPVAINVPEGAAVITIKGICSGAAAKPAASTSTRTAAGETKTSPATAKTASASDCKTVITRAQWEQTLSLINRPIPPQFRRQVAEQFVNLYELANAGTKAGLEKDPKVQERLKLSHMQVLGNAYMEKLHEQQPSQSAIDAYYKANAPQFESVTLKRVYVPKPTAADGKPPDEAAAKMVAQKIRDRAAAGEDFDKLQKEAYDTTGNKGTPPPTSMGEKRRGSLPPKHEDDVFKLNVGDVSPAYEEQSGFFIYKVEKKGVAPLEQVKPEIERKLDEDKTREALDKLKNSTTVVYNDAYFGAPAAASPSPGAGEPPSAPAPSGANRRPASPPPPTTGAEQPSDGTPAQTTPPSPPPK